MVRSGSAQERLKVEIVPRAQVYEFAPFRLDTACRQLLREGQPVGLPPKAYDILVALVENRERLVERDELMQLVWPDVIVEEANLTQNVFTLRKILGDDQSAPRYIETLPRRGYRFIAPVTVMHETVSPDDADAMGTVQSPLAKAIRRSHRRRHALYVVGILAAAAAAGALAVSLRDSRSLSALPGERIRLAVLPFVNLSADPEQEYFSDGLTEELIAHLGSLRPQRLGVIARTSAMRYKGARQGVDEIGRELGVQYVVEGSVRRSSGQLRITARLVNVIDQTDVWTETYERSLEDIFAIHRDIAARISRSLALELLPNEQRSSVPRVWTTSPAAYESYLLGVFHSHPTLAEASKSIQYFERAIQLDPGYAPAYAKLAASYQFLASGNLAPDREMYPKARDAALQALALDETLAGPHGTLGFVKWRFEWDWSGARKEFIRSFDINPNHSGHEFGLFLYSTGNFEEAIAQMQRAQSLDPLDFLARWNLGRVFHTVRRFDDAIAQFRRALEIRPDHPWPYGGIGLVLLEQGRNSEGITQLERAKELGERDPNVTSRLAYAYAKVGNTTAAERLVRELERAGDENVPAFFLAAPHHALGRREAALAWLERAYAARDDMLVYLKVDPLFQTFRSDPGVQDLIRRIGIP